MQNRGNRCYFQAIKHDPEVQGALSIFRLWQKENPETSDYKCHLYKENEEFVLGNDSKLLIDKYMPELSVSETYLETVPDAQSATNNVILENIINSIFTNDLDTTDNETVTPNDDISLSVETPEAEASLDETRLLTPSDIADYPIKLTQQQLLLFNSLSNRITWLFNDMSKYNIPVQVLQPHEAALQRMINASREIQLKLQSFSRKHPAGQAYTETPISTAETPTKEEMSTVEKEKQRLESQLDMLNDKLKFFSSEYQRITELYLQEKSKNQKTEEEGTLSDEVNNASLTKHMEQYNLNIKKLMKEREEARSQLQSIRQQAEELEYALKRLLETGTVISPSLDDEIKEVLSNQSLMSLGNIDFTS